MALPVRRSAGAPLAVEQWDPFRELMQGVFGSTMQNGQTAFIPRFDIEETEDAWIVEAELPGVKREDVNVELRGSELAISGEIKEREREGILRRRTRRVGQFDFHVTLPAAVDPDDITAVMRDGVLRVHVPKPQPARRQRIEVK
jgi:HSP20 family protein